MAENGIRTEAQALLAKLAGADAQLRTDQWVAIEALVLNRRRVLCVQRTGWGKSAVYFIAGALLRSRGAGPSIIVSPLLALMRNQIDAAVRAGIVARTINSSNPSDFHNIADEVHAGIVDVLLVSPERLNNPDFRDFVLPDLSAAAGLVVIDEAHCISDWGHDFRPDYRRIRTLLEGLPQRTPVLATTATANTRVITDISEQLGETLVLRGPLDRESLCVGVLSLPTTAHRLAWLADRLTELPGSGIIYTLTVSAANDTAAFLRSRGHAVEAYSGKTEDTERQAAEADLINNKLKALVATSALGMGFDKPDLGFVVHMGAPPSPVAYYQQIGRAGRSANRASVVLLPGEDDEAIWRYFALLAFPAEQHVRRVLQELAVTPSPLSTQALEVRIDLGRGQLEHMLKVLDVDGAVRRVGGGWVSTGADWRYDTARFERVSAARAAEQDSMREFIATSQCRMEFLRRCLDDEGAQPCGRCDNCGGQFISSDISDRSLRAARRHLARVGVEISPRTRWPSGLSAIGVNLSGNIPESQRAKSGRAIARLTDLGSGGKLRHLLEGSTSETSLPDDVFKSVLSVLAEWLKGEPIQPVGIVGIESRKRSLIATGLAERIASALVLPLMGALSVAPSDIGDGRANSARRVAALHSAITVPSKLVELLRTNPGVILLVDDFVDSGWTMTLAARALRQAGAAVILPFALGISGRRE